MISIIRNEACNKAVYNAFIKVTKIYKCEFNIDLHHLEINEKTKNKKQIIKELFKRREDVILVPNIFLCTFLSLLGFKCCLWMQGVAPQESYLRHKSKLRKKILSYIEYAAVMLAHEVIYVSSYMCFYYNEKYKTKAKATVLPCLSELKYDGSVKIKNSFCYIGGLSKWQKIDEMLLVFNVIKKEIPNATFYVATENISDFLDIANKVLTYDVINDLSVVSLSTRSEVQSFLSRYEYGFLLRDNCLINHVSSPIKLGEYLSCGVNIIISESVRSFSYLVNKYNAGMILNEPYDSNLSIEGLKFNLKASLLAYDEISNINNNDLNKSK